MDDVEQAVYALIESAIDSASDVDDLDAGIDEAAELARAWDLDFDSQLALSSYEQRRDELESDREPDEDDWWAEIRYTRREGETVSIPRVRSETETIRDLFDSLSDHLGAVE